MSEPIYEQLSPPQWPDSEATATFAAIAAAQSTQDSHQGSQPATQDQDGWERAFPEDDVLVPESPPLSPRRHRPSPRRQREVVEIPDSRPGSPADSRPGSPELIRLNQPPPPPLSPELVPRRPPTLGSGLVLSPIPRRSPALRSEPVPRNELSPAPEREPSPPPASARESPDFPMQPEDALLRQPEDALLRQPEDVLRPEPISPDRRKRKRTTSPIASPLFRPVTPPPEDVVFRNCLAGGRDRIRSPPPFKQKSRYRPPLLSPEEKNAFVFNNCSAWDLLPTGDPCYKNNCSKCRAHFVDKWMTLQRTNSWRELQVGFSPSPTPP